MSAPSVGTLCCRATVSLDGFSSAINLCTHCKRRQTSHKTIVRPKTKPINTAQGVFIQHEVRRERVHPAKAHRDFFNL